jgi:OOP family OmpA-OmpF porin
VVETTPEPPLEPIPVTEPTPEKTKYFVYLNVQFDIARANIRPQYRDEMAKVGDFMKKYPATNAIIEGYTDSVGTDDFNMQLSLQRADSVVKSLEVNFGIDSSRLTARGYGKTMPVATNATNAGRQENRHINAIIDCAVIDVSQIPPPDRLAMSLNVEFNSHSAAIQPAYYGAINTIGDYMNKYPTTSAIIEGHTDNEGTDEYLMQLSQQRAESVVAYLVDKYGIDRSRLTAKGYGDTRRIAYNTTPEGRQRNRRINAIIDFPLAK